MNKQQLMRTQFEAIEEKLQPYLEGKIPAELDAQAADQLAQSTGLPPEQIVNWSEAFRMHEQSAELAPSTYYGLLLAGYSNPVDPLAIRDPLPTRFVKGSSIF